MTTAATRTVVLLGHPVDHSLSPRIHSAAFAAAGIDAVYVTADVAPGQVPAAVDGLRALRLLGANVTIPHKQRVAEVLAEAQDRGSRLTADAALAGAVNTLYWDDDTLVGANTDISGLVRILRDDIGVGGGDTIEIFGSGGSARAAAVAAGQLGLRVRVTARRTDAAATVATLAARAGSAVPESPAGTPGAAAPATDARPRVVVNATPLGMHGEPLPPPYLALATDQTALDLVYAPSTTPFVTAARQRGARAIDGRTLLVAQAADSFTCWTGRTAPTEVMTAAVSG